MARKPPDAPIGPHAGRALADLISRIIVHTRSAMAPIEADQRRRSIEGMMDDWEGEIGRFVSDLFEPMGLIDDKPAWLAGMLARAESPQHQTDFILSLLVGIAGAFSLVSQGGAIVWRNTINDLYKSNPYVPLSPADSADAVIRTVLEQGEAAGYAAQSGVNGKVFDVLVELTGEPPPLDEMRTLLIQGRISQGDFAKILEYSRVRNQWLDDYVKAHYKPLSAADAVEGFIKGHLSRDDAAARYGVGGGMPDEFDLAALIAGNPIGVEQALTLWNHKLIDEAEVDAVIRASRINPIFEGIAKLTRFRYLTAFQIESALSSGQATAEEATRWLLEEGYPADQVAALVKAGTTTKAAKAKLAAESVVLDTYEAGLIDQPQAVARLADLGYHNQEAAIILESYDARRLLTMRNQGVTAVQKAYKAGYIDHSTASGDLDSLGVSSVLRDHYLNLWDIERKTEFKTLTKAEIGSLFKKGIVTQQWAMQQWIALGYNPAIATLLAYDYGAPVPNNQPVV